MSGRRRGGGSEMGGVGVARNKRGTPMYSREDIREQYCINDKELHALEASRRKPIFGCLTSSNTQPSPCKKKSLLPACLRGRVPSDENVYSKSQSAHTSPAHRKAPETIDYEDDTYFRRRPKTICYTDPRRLASLDDSLSKSGRVSRPRSDAGNTSYESYLNEDAGDPSRRPTQLTISSGEYHSTEIYQEDANNREGYTIRRTAFTQPNTPDMGHSTRFHQVTTPEIFLDDRPQKHVSFQKAMSRSATVGGLEDHGSMTRDDSGRGSVKSGGSRSQERLLDGRRTPDYVEQRALDQLLAPVLTKALLQEPGHRRQRKHPGEGKKEPGGRQVDSEAGSRSESRSRSRTPSLRRRKPEKRTIAIQTDEIPDDFDLPEDDGGVPPKHLENQGSKRELKSRSGRKGLETVAMDNKKETGEVDTIKETADGEKKVSKRPKKSKKKATEEIPPETSTRKGSVHFSDETFENIHIIENVEVSPRPVKNSKKKSESSKPMPEKESSHSRRDVASQEPVKVIRKQTKDTNCKMTDTEVQEDTKHEPRPPDNTKVSMGMQTDSLVPFLPKNSIFMTEDLDTSADWHGEESSDWQQSAGSLGWHTDASSFAWHTDASLYGRQTDASSCRADNSSFAPDSCEEMAEESEEEENMMNMDIDLIKEKLDQTDEDILLDREGQSGSDTGNIDSPLQEAEDHFLKDQGKGSVPNLKEANQEGGIDSQEESDTNIMVRRLRFRRQLAEEFLQQNAQVKVQGSHQDILKEKIIEEEGEVTESSQFPKARSKADPGNPGKEKHLHVSTFPRKVNTPRGSSKEEGDIEETMEARTEMIPLETSRTWPKSFIEQGRSDDIDLKSFHALSDVHTTRNRKHKEEKPGHKTSWLEINLVKKEVERTETPKCVQISNSQLNKNAENLNADFRGKIQQQHIDISDEYPKSDHDYKSHTPGSLPLKKSSPRSDGSRSLQRRKKVSQKESSDSSTSHQLDNRNQDNRKLKDVTKSPLTRFKESLPSRLKNSLPLESPRLSSSTDTSSIIPPVTGSVGKRMKKSKKVTASSQTKDEDGIKDAAPNSSNVHLNKVIEEEAEVRELPLQENELVIGNESSKENEASKSPGTSSLRRKRSLKRRKSICIQTDFSYDEPTEDPIENVANEKSEVIGSARITSEIPEKETIQKISTAERSNEPKSGNGKNEKSSADPRSETESIVTNTSSLRRIKKVRKATTSTQTEEAAQDEIWDDNHLDSVSVRTSSLRRIRKVEKKSVEIQTDLSLLICLENLHLSILDFDEVRNSEVLSASPGLADSLIYVNIPAAFLEIGESGNDADISDADSEDEGDGARNIKEKIYSKVVDGKIVEDKEEEAEADGNESHDSSDVREVIGPDENVSEEEENEEVVVDDSHSCIDDSEREVSSSHLEEDISTEAPGEDVSEDQPYICEDDTPADIPEEENENDLHNQTFTITEEDLTRKPDDEEDTSDEDEDFDIYIVDQQNSENDAEKTSTDQLNVGKVEEKNMARADIKGDKQRKVAKLSKQPIAIYVEDVDVSLDKSCNDEVSEETESTGNKTYRNIPRPYTASDENTVEREDLEHDSGVSEEEPLREPWYFGAQDKTFELLEGTEENRRQDTVIYCPANGVEGDARLDQTSTEDEELVADRKGDTGNQEITEQEDYRVQIARKQFKEMHYPYGKGHFSEGDSHQAHIYFESLRNTYDESTQDEQETEKERKNNINEEPGEENEIVIEKESTGKQQCSIEADEAQDDSEFKKGKESTDEQHHSAEDKELENKKEFQKENQGTGEQRMSVKDNGSEDSAEQRKSVKDNGSQDSAEPLSSAKKYLEKADRFATKRPEIRIQVPSCEVDPAVTSLEDKISEDDRKDAEFMLESFRNGTPDDGRYEEENSYDIQSPSVTTRSDNESYRDGSPCSTRSGSEFFRDNQGDAISLAMASEYGHELSEEEDDEVIIFTYKKVRQTREDERWKSKERMVHKDVEKVENTLYVNKETESPKGNQEVKESAQGREKEVEKEAGVAVEKGASVKPKRKRQPKKTPAEGVERVIVNEPPSKEESQADTLSEREESQGKDQVSKEQDNRKEDPLSSREVPLIRQLPKEEAIQREGHHMPEREECQSEGQLPEGEQTQKQEEIQHEVETQAEPTETEVRKKKKRPRNRKKKNKSESGKETQEDDTHDDQSLPDNGKNDLDLRESEQRETEASGQEIANERSQKHKLWADEIEENLSKEWRSCESDKGGKRDSERGESNLETLEQGGKELQILKSREEEEEEDTSCYGDEGDESSHYDGDSSRYEDSEAGEGGGEQNALEEYLLIKEGDCQEEMREVDRMFRDALKNYGDDFLTDEDNTNHLQTGKGQGHGEMKLKGAYGDPTDWGSAQSKVINTSEACSGASRSEHGDTIRGHKTSVDGKSIKPQADMIDMSQPPVKSPRSRKSRKNAATAQAKKGEDSRPADNIEG